MNKMYVLVRKDLPRSQRTVQACHVVAEYLLKEYVFTNLDTIPSWDNGTMIVYEVANKEDLKLWQQKLEKYTSHLFYEPDVDEYTSLCCVLSDQEAEQAEINKLYLL